MLTILSAPHAVTIPRHISHTYRRKPGYSHVAQQPRVSDKFVATVLYVMLPSLFVRD